MGKLCCIFNYAPLYRKSIYKKIDDTFDAQFYFGDMKSDIVKMDYNDFKKFPKTVRDVKLFGKLLWRRDIQFLPFANFKHYLIIGDVSYSYFPFIVFCHLMGKKVYAWGHGYKSFDGKMGWYTKWLAQHFDVFFTYGERGKERMIELGIPNDKLEVIYNSLNVEVNPERQKALSSGCIKEHFGNDNPILLFVGRLTKVKQLDWIIKAHAIHKALGVNYNTLIIGDGSERKSLESLALSEGVSENIWFYGECYNDDELSKLLYNADLCVSPGNVGLTALHAMSYGTPVLSNDDFETQMPEYETIVRGETGELYKKGNFSDFCLKIETWLSRDCNREQIRQKCYSMIKGKWNSDFQIDILKKILVGDDE
ncbi:MAG: glycosyltransferase [Bacteroidales bacterium]|nr:glycosyltransferase [Bacteroidales bacterium]